MELNNESVELLLSSHVISFIEIGFWDECASTFGYFYCVIHSKQQRKLAKFLAFISGYVTYYSSQNMQ